MEQTNNLALPYLIAAQAQKHVTHNEALRMLDSLVQIGAVARNAQTPPAEPAEGQRYLLAANPDGEWTGRGDSLAAYQDGSWAFFAPLEGWLVWVADEQRLLVRQDNAWEIVNPDITIDELQNATKVGVNTTADDTNRLAVSANSSLFTHAGNDHRLVINKQAQGDTASLLMQSNYSGRAEIGLAGEDRLSFKVSDDGSNWREALSVDGETGKVRVAQGLEPAQLSGIPASFEAYDILYMDAISGDDGNDGTSSAKAIKSFQGLRSRLPIGRHTQLRLLSDVVCDETIAFRYAVPLLEILGRNDNDTGAQARNLIVAKAKNFANYCGGFTFYAHASVYLREVNVALDADAPGAFIDIYNSTGYVRTFLVNLSRDAAGQCSLFSNGGSFVPSSHSALTIAPSARGYIAKGVAANANPNDDWRYPSNITSF